MKLLLDHCLQSNPKSKIDQYTPQQKKQSGKHLTLNVWGPIYPN